jgi:hypothetical protein
MAKQRDTAPAPKPAAEKQEAETKESVDETKEAVGETTTAADGTPGAASETSASNDSAAGAGQDSVPADADSGSAVDLDSLQPPTLEERIAYVEQYIREGEERIAEARAELSRLQEAFARAHPAPTALDHIQNARAITAELRSERAGSGSRSGARRRRLAAAQKQG